MTDEWWNTIDFQPAPPGWRVVYLYPKLREVFHIAGWLIQEHYFQEPEDPYRIIADMDDSEEILGRRRRVIPGIIVEGYGWQVMAVDDNMGDVDRIWMVLPPGASEPTLEEEQAERASRARKNNGGKP